MIDVSPAEILKGIWNMARLCRWYLYMHRQLAVDPIGAWASLLIGLCNPIVLHSIIIPCSV